MDQQIRLERCSDYSTESVERALEPFAEIFARTIRSGDTVALKPNWIAAHHKHKPEEWKSVITHPAVISGVLGHVLRCLDGRGKVIISDGPQTDQSFAAIMQRMTVPEWEAACTQAGVEFEVLDLRDHEWTVRGDVLVDRRELPGDPAGSVEYNLGEYSEFVKHTPSSAGYYGADYDVDETTRAHTGGDHRYRISGSMAAADVFINIPKCKTHKKAGITCSLKNLVGINTYKNFLPHHTEGTPAMGGDQFPDSGTKNAFETRLLRVFKGFLLRYPQFGKLAIPVKRVGKKIFGETTDHVRNGAWYGNDTLWRTILDLNKALLYGNTDGTLRDPAPDQRKRYISIVDAVIAGEGNGPEAPDPTDAGFLIGGNNPVSVDCLAARMMGFDYQKIPSLKHSFMIQHYPIIDQSYDEFEVVSESLPEAVGKLDALSEDIGCNFRPHFGWTGHIERPTPQLSTAAVGSTTDD